MKAELYRLEHGRKRKRINLVYEAELTRNQKIAYKNAVDGAYEGE